MIVRQADFSDPENIKLASANLETSDRQEIAALVDRFCQSHLESPASNWFQSELSVGATFGVKLENQKEVIIKIWSRQTEIPKLRAQISVQDHLSKVGFPSPSLVTPLVEFEGFPFLAMEVMSGDHFAGIQPKMSSAMAALLADMLNAANQKTASGDLDRGWLDQLNGNLWPAPHNDLFDFEATQKGAEWIDEIAAESLSILHSDQGSQLVSHLDWSCKNMLAEGDVISAVFDWDSVSLQSEAQTVGDAAASFSQTWYLDVQRIPLPADAGAFVRAYERSKGQAFSEEQLGIIAARTTYSIAYGARCCHALGQASVSDNNNALARLKQTGAFTPTKMKLI